MLVVADPTIILVHGAFADPLRGVTVEDAGYTRCVIEQVEGPVLLVGHSYGGAVIASGVADNVAGLVYVAGMAPDEGEVIVEIQSRFPAAVVGPYIKPSPLPDGGRCGAADVAVLLGPG